MTTLSKSYMPAGVTPLRPKYQLVKLLLKLATMSGPAFS